jgi:hypothetical protein
MNDPNDSLETELAAMRPVAISPELRSRIGNELNEPPAKHSSNTWLAPLSAGLAAAGLAAALLIWLWSTPTVAPNQPVVRSDLQPPFVLNGGLPTVWSYHKAIRRASADLDAVLAMRGRSNSTAREPAEVAAFTRSSAQLRALTGEL